MSVHSFTRCPHCQQETARPVETCIRCGHSAAQARPQEIPGLGFLFIMLLIGGAGFALWWFIFAKPSPIVGAWKKGGVSFTFRSDGEAVSNGIFQPGGAFIPGTREITSRWRTAGNRLTLTPQNSVNQTPRDIEWSIADKTLTLKGLDSIGTIRSTITLRRVE